MARQIKANREELERVTGKRTRSIAYPFGDYDLRVAGKCRELGIDRRYAVDFRSAAVEGTPDRRSVPRMDAHKPSLSIVGFRVQWGNLLRQALLRSG
jgi:peptidoglycan/xylan/chitin deacetylase (PgdA/CDA1 family)